MKAYDFCIQSLEDERTPKYVKIQMRQWMDVVDGKDEKYYVSEKKVQQIENIMKILIMPKGLKAGQTLYDSTCGSQWLQPQSDKDVSKFLNANIGQFLHAIAAIRIGADTFS